MKLTDQEVKKVSALANLPLTETEITTFSNQLSDIISYIDLLNKADTKEVDPVFDVFPESNVFHEDTVGQSLTTEEALSNTENKKDGYFTTRGIFD